MTLTQGKACRAPYRGGRGRVEGRGGRVRDALERGDHDCCEAQMAKKIPFLSRVRPTHCMTTA